MRTNKYSDKTSNHNRKFNLRSYDNKDTSNFWYNELGYMDFIPVQHDIGYYAANGYEAEEWFNCKINTMNNT